MAHAAAEFARERPYLTCCVRLSPEKVGHIIAWQPSVPISISVTSLLWFCCHLPGRSPSAL